VKVISLNLEVKGKRLELSVEEAKELFDQLSQWFGIKYIYPSYISTTPLKTSPWDYTPQITCGSGTIIGNCGGTGCL